MRNFFSLLEDHFSIEISFIVAIIGSIINYKTPFYGFGKYGLLYIFCIVFLLFILNNVENINMWCNNFNYSNNDNFYHILSQMERKI